MPPVFTIKNPMPPGMFFRRFTYAVRRVQDEVEAEHQHRENMRALNWLNTVLQQELLQLLMSAGPVNYADACKPPTGLWSQAFKITIGVDGIVADRAARKSPPVNVIYMGS